MSLLRAAALLGRAGLVSGPALPAQLGALTALQHKLTGCLSHQQPAAWLQARGWSAAPGGGSSGGGGSGGSGPDQQAASQQEQRAAAAAATGDEKADTKQPAEQGAGAPQTDAPPQASAGQQAAQQAEPSGKQAAAAEAESDAGSQQPSGQSFEQDPRLAKFVEGLKQLKGGVRGAETIGR